MSDLVKRLRIKAGMIEMGERIAWGSDSALMREAADALETAAPDHIADARKMVAAAAQGVWSGPLPANRYGVDCDYFTKKLEILIRDMGNYTPAELARSLGRLAMTADPETMREPEFNTAPAVQGEPVGLSRFIEMIEARASIRKSGMIDGITLLRDLRAMLAATPSAPQPAEQQPAPDVGALVEALSIARDYVFSSLEEKKLALAGYPQMWRCEQDDLAMIDAALAAHSKSGGVQQVNTHLIAAAPDLYEALEDLVKQYGHPNISGWVEIELAIAALAKARGES